MGWALLRVLFYFSFLLCAGAPRLEAKRAWPEGPVLAADTLSASHRAAMAAELGQIRASLRRAGQTWTAAETSFLRLSRAERDQRLLKRPWPTPMQHDRAPYVPRGYKASDSRLDWRDRNGCFVTPVREQADCAASWCFAATACMESAILVGIKGGRVPDLDLSEQQVLSCLGDHGLTGSCQGGWADDVLWFALNVGIAEEGCLVPRGDVLPPCSDDCADPLARRFRIAEYGFVCHELDAAAIKDALHNFGPLATTMTVHQGFEAYAGGIYRASGAVTGYHAVLIIGYDDKAGCFIAKNSWGEGWGMGGFFLIAYDSGCGFGNWSTYARYEAAGSAPFAALWTPESRVEAGAAVLFESRSVPVSAALASWEWDFNGDGKIDATGPGPHRAVYRRPGAFRPSLRVTDKEGRTDLVALRGRLEVVWGGPTWVVDAASGSVYGDGSREHPFANIQMALNAAADGDTVLIKPGRYHGPMNSALAPGTKGLLLKGEGAPGAVSLDGEGGARLLVIEAEGKSPFQVENLHFIRGHDAQRGGAVLIEGGSPRFVSCRFTRCAVGSGPDAAGGAVWSGGSPQFEDCSFSDNRSAGEGGAIYSEGGALSLAACVFEDNVAGEVGGALSAIAGSLSVRHSFFAGNESSNRGGALNLLDLDAGIDGSFFRGNRVNGEDPLSGGGAVACEGEQELTMSNCILADNAASRGGAFLFAGGEAHLNHLTSWRNRATAQGGALSSTIGGELRVSNSIFWLDEASQDSEFSAPGARVTRCLAGGGFAGGMGVIDGDPRFSDPSRGDFHLMADSPCLSAGFADGALTADYDGFARPQPPGSAPDLGACESPLAAGESAAGALQASRLSFRGIFPNPFNPSTTFAFDLPAPAMVRLLVIHPAGRRVATVLEEHLAAGSHSVPWMALDENGQALASGLFLVRLECRYEDGREETEIRKAILVK